MPPSYGPKLASLQLSGNMLSGQIPAAFAKLAQLKGGGVLFSAVDVSNNHIEHAVTAPELGAWVVGAPPYLELHMYSAFRPRNSPTHLHRCTAPSPTHPPFHTLTHQPTHLRDVERLRPQYHCTREPINDRQDDRRPG